MGGLIAPYAFAAACAERVARAPPRTLRGIFCRAFGAAFSLVQLTRRFLVTSLISGFTAVSLTLQVRRRSKLIRAGIGVGVRYLVVIADVWPDRSDQSVFAESQMTGDDRLPERAGYLVMES